jgi:hypothetical protein
MESFITLTVIFAVIFFAILLRGNSNNNLNLKLFTGRIFQTLETIYLIEYTTKLDTFKSRFAFLMQLSADLNAYRGNDKYMYCVQEALSKYKTKYYDRKISQLQNDILNKPSIVNTQEFHDIQYLNFFMRTSDKIFNEMNALKTQKAKERRKEMILDVAKEVLTVLNHQESIKYHSTIVDELKRFDIKMKLEYPQRDTPNTDDTPKNPIPGGDTPPKTQ